MMAALIPLGGCCVRCTNVYNLSLRTVSHYSESKAQLPATLCTAIAMHLTPARTQLRLLTHYPLRATSTSQWCAPSMLQPLQDGPSAHAISND
jgi:hypothetical protein